MNDMQKTYLSKDAFLKVEGEVSRILVLGRDDYTLFRADGWASQLMRLLQQGHALEDIMDAISKSSEWMPHMELIQKELEVCRKLMLLSGGPRVESPGSLVLGDWVPGSFQTEVDLPDAPRLPTEIYAQTSPYVSGPHPCAVSEIPGPTQTGYCQYSTSYAGGD